MSDPDIDALRHSVGNLSGQVSAEINRRKTSEFLNWQNQFAERALSRAKSPGGSAWQLFVVKLIFGLFAIYAATIVLLSPGIAVLCLLGYTPSDTLSRWLPPIGLDLVAWVGLAGLHTKIYPHKKSYVKGGFVFYLLLCGIISACYLIFWFSGAAFPKTHWQMFFN